jgi:peroxin-11B
MIAFTLTISKICQSLFLLVDHILWLARSGLFKNIDTTKWTTRSNKFWLFSLVMNIVRDVYEINRLITCYSHHKNITECIFSTLVSIRGFADLKRYSQTTLDFMKVYKYLTIDTIKNCCDLFIPLSSLGYFNLKLSPRTIGILGAISSLMGIMALLDPSYKLIPQ